jgi:hypothetical protein
VDIGRSDLEIRGVIEPEGSPSVESRVDNVGLCARCVHARRVTSSRGSVFYLCGLSEVDANFPKYPRLPVLQCSGFSEPETSAAE